MENKDHIVRAYDSDLEDLSGLFSRMSGLAEAQLEGAMKAVETRNEELAASIRQSDKEIDELEKEIENLAVKTIALRQPMADDLRYIISCLKTASDVERIGDYAKNIAKRSIVLNQSAPMPMTGSIMRMARSVQGMLKDVFDAFIQGDAEKALAVWEADAEVDNHYTSLFRELLTYMMEDPRHITPCTHLLFIAKNIERMGDLATNVAETVYYRVKGQPLAGTRPKADSSTTTVVDPEDVTP